MPGRILRSHLWSNFAGRLVLLVFLVLLRQMAGVEPAGGTKTAVEPAAGTNDAYFASVGKSLKVVMDYFKDSWRLMVQSIFNLTGRILGPEHVSGFMKIIYTFWPNLCNARLDLASRVAYVAGE